MHIKRIVRDIIILFMLSLIPLLWFKRGCFIASGDVAQYLDLSNLMRFFPWSWDERIAAGEPCLSTTFSLPYGYFWLMLKSIGLHLIAIEKMWVFSTFFVSAVSMYVFVRGFVQNKDSFAPLFAGIFYSYNLFLVVAPLIVQYNLAPLYMFGPLAFSFWTRGLASDTYGKKWGYACLVALSSLLYAHTNVNMPHVAAFVVIVIIYTGYHFAFISKHPAKDIVFVCVCVFLYLSVNLWWMVSSLVTMFQMSDIVQGTRSGWHLLWATHLDEAFRFLGFWAWTHTHNNLYYFPFNESYASWPFILCSYGVVFFALYAVFLKKREVVFPLVTLLVGLFLVKGGTGPLGFLYEYCWKNVPGLWIFREPWSKFTHINIFALSVLFGISAAGVFEKAKTWVVRAKETQRWITILQGAAVRLYPILIITLLLVTAYPAVTGQVIWDQYNYNVRSMQVKVPEYWPRLGEWFRKNDPHARVFILPKTGYARGPYDWESGFTSASTAAISFLPNQLAYYTDFPTTRAHALFNDLFAFFREDSRENIAPALKTLGVKYVLQQNDVSWKYTWDDNVSPEQMRVVLLGRPELRFVESFGKLDLYEVKDPGSLFAVSSNINVIVGKDVRMFDVARKGVLSAPYLVSDDGQVVEWMKKEGLRVNSVTWAQGGGAQQNGEGVSDKVKFLKDVRRINPTKYIVTVSARTPFWLVFNESFNPGWNVRIRELGEQHSVVVEHSALLTWFVDHDMCRTVSMHVRLNDYANGWFVDKTGEYTLVVEYTPQRMYELAKIVSWISGIGMSLFIACRMLLGKRVHKR